MNILIPMAGAGSRFERAGYKLPKPLIDVCGKPMIERVIESLSSNKLDTNFIFVVQKEHLDLGLQDYLKGKGSIITINKKKIDRFILKLNFFHPLLFCEAKKQRDG